MPFWLLPILSLLAKFGLPVLEAKFPKLAPLLDILLKVLGGAAPPAALQSAADHYEKACSGVACPTDLSRM